MIDQPKLRLSVVVLALIFISGCGFLSISPQAIATLEPKYSEMTLAIVQTEASGKVISQMTLEALINPSPTNTFTPYPSKTATPVPLIPLIQTINPPAKTASPYECSVVAQYPQNGTIFRSGFDFDGKWTIKNVGTAVWDTSSFHLNYIGGDYLNKRNNSYDLPKMVVPGDTINVIVDLMAPLEKGSYTTIWGITSQKVDACLFSLRIVVN